MTEGLKDKFLERMTNGYNQGQYTVHDIESEIYNTIESRVIAARHRQRCEDFLAILKPEEKSYVAQQMYSHIVTQSQPSLTGTNAGDPMKLHNVFWATDVWKGTLGGLPDDSARAYAAIDAEQNAIHPKNKDYFERPQGGQYLDEAARDVLRDLSKDPVIAAYIDQVKKQGIPLDLRDRQPQAALEC